MLIGLFLIFVGTQKLIQPYQNFLVVVQGYQLLSPLLEEIVARVGPWVEVLLGVFLLVGLWLNWTLKACLALFAVFIVFIAQALIRGLPLEDCGCFGEILTLKLPVTLVIDSLLLLMTLFLIRHVEEVSSLSLDRYYQ
jgi:hypothetical protein